jgi:hypothetical protein
VSTTGGISIPSAVFAESQRLCPTLRGKHCTSLKYRNTSGNFWTVYADREFGVISVA